MKSTICQFKELDESYRLSYEYRKSARTIKGYGLILEGSVNVSVFFYYILKPHTEENDHELDQIAIRV